ncbi:hypothetical protein WIW50_11360 [Flavobacteriaceae bacterium 3-367]|uniref:hypothetical protein n=1 Tax=Eudoraea algarum TaxID=3417568 RepID=UPI0032880B13
MKSYVVLFVAFSMLIRPLWPIVEYAMNYDYIVNVLCENKDRPQLQCDGKCYLSKQLASQQSEQDPFGENPLRTQMQHPVFFQSLCDLHLQIVPALDRKTNFNTPPRFLSTLLTSDISEPPELG